jgi:protein phosphatase 1 regulatory subunit 37
MAEVATSMMMSGTESQNGNSRDDTALTPDRRVDSDTLWPPAPINTSVGDMNSPSTSSPSSSAVVIPTPGKSILKRAPAAQQSLFSRITTRFLPTDKPLGKDEEPLKRAHFILPQIATVYPISSSNPPSMPTLKDEKRAIETREAERRRRVVRANSISSGKDEEDWWSLEKVESFYRECCAGCQERPDPAISAAFKVTFSSHEPNNSY